MCPFVLFLLVAIGGRTRTFAVGISVWHGQFSFSVFKLRFGLRFCKAERAAELENGGRMNKDCTYLVEEDGGNFYKFD